MESYKMVCETTKVRKKEAETGIKSKGDKQKTLTNVVDIDPII